MELVQIDPAVEPVRECFDNPRPQHRLRPVDRNLGRNPQPHQGHDHRPGNP